MLQFLDSADDVIALNISEKVTSADLDVIMDRLDAAMARHDKVHLFIETRSIDGIELAGLAAHIGRAMPLFGKLKQFGRIAVVADQMWLRAATRLESALLPFVSYKVYMPDQRAAALAWVEGKSTA